MYGTTTEAESSACDPEAVFAQLVAYHRVEADRRGEVHVRCPNPRCSNPDPKGGTTHFSFSVKGGKCFICGEAWSLSHLAAIWLDPDRPLPSGVVQVRHRRRRSEYPACWFRQSPDWYAERYQRRMDLVDCWQAYKPVELESIAFWKLGVGKLPFYSEDDGRWYWSKYEKLIVPVFRDGQLIALRGRAFLPADPATDPASGKKWMNATNTMTALFNGELVRPGCDVLVVENMIDAIVIMQYARQFGRDRLVAVASTAGAGTWKPSWTAHLAAQQPRELAVCLDNDLAGQPNKETWPLAVARWRAKHPQAADAPKPHGPAIVNDLRKAGAPARLYHWPSGTPLTADPYTWFV